MRVRDAEAASRSTGDGLGVGGRFQNGLGAGLGAGLGVGLGGHGAGGGRVPSGGRVPNGGRVPGGERSQNGGGPTTPAAARLDTGWRDGLTFSAVLIWIPGVLWPDRTASGSIQLLLGLISWTLLIALLARQTVPVRVQAAVVVGFATLVEYTFSAGLHVYDYRLGHVPAYVPPGHGLVYLGAISIGRFLGRSRLGRQFIWLAVGAGGAYAGWGLFAPVHPDVLGAFWYLCLLAFLVLGKSRFMYVGAFVIVTYLEIVGTRWGVWHWNPVDPTGLVTIGNPPTGAAGGYGWFDLAAIYASRAWLGRMGVAPDPLEPEIAHARLSIHSCVDNNLRVASCKSPFVEIALPQSALELPSNDENRPPASVTISATEATS